MAVSFPSSSPTEAALFNPAFVALLLASAARNYATTAAHALPVELAFLVPPLALHEGTRAALPGNVNGRMSSWVLANPVVAGEFPARARAMTPLVREGLRYGLLAAAMAIEDARLVSRLHPSADTALGTLDARDCVRASAFAGRWFARTGDSATIFGLLGVRP
jgi:hypothetical protein